MTEDLGSHLHYDEQVAVETYVLRNFRPLLTPAELEALDGSLAHWWDENLERMHEWGAHARASTVAPPWEPVPFEEAHIAQVRAIVGRLREKHGSAVEPARCPRCTRILRAPDDPICPWCLNRPAR